jgi:hypothetical protein
MKSDATKLELIEWLAKVDDDGILAALMLFKKANQTSDWADNLTREQHLKVEEGREDLKKGRVVKNSKVWEKYGRKG